MQASKQETIAIWDKVAPTFSTIGPNYWQTFGERLVELSSIEKGAKILDIGVGRGASLFPAVAKCGEDGKVIGIDISEVMIRETYKDIAIRKINNAEVIRMDAENLSYSDNSFDNILCGFSIGCLLGNDNKLSEVLRILKIGGQVAFTVWGVQEDQKWMIDMFNKHLDMNKDSQCKISDKDNIRKTHSTKFDTVEDMIKILEGSGFKNIKVHEENNVVIYKNKEECWQEMKSNADRGSFEQIEKLGTDKLNEYKVDLYKGLEKYKIESGIHLNMPVIYAFGEK